MRLIDADACIKKLERIWNIPHDWDGDIDETCETAFDVIENQPTVEAKPVVHGEWERIYVDEKLGNRTTNMCTACGEKCWLKYDYCPNCGADMRGGKNEKNI